MLNKRNRTKIFTVLLFSMIFLTTILQNSINSYWSNDINDTSTDQTPQVDNNIELKSNAVITDLISINGSATGVGAHNWTWAKEQGYVSRGYGSQSSPYIIENLEIDGQNSHGGIEIVDSRNNFSGGIYFRIENNIIYNVGFANSHSAGIKLYKTQLGTITNNIISSDKDGNYGIHIVGYKQDWEWSPPYTETSKDLNITSNTITYTERGIFIEQFCESITVSENTAKYNDLAGVYISRGCTKISVIDNTLSENDVFGLADTDSNNYIVGGQGNPPDYTYSNTIKYNNITNNAYGFYLALTKGSTISYNNISSNSITGMYISGSSWNYIANNTIANNTDKGLLMVMGPSGSFRNMIWGNEFLDNGIHAEELTSPPPFPVMGAPLGFPWRWGWENNWSWYKSGQFSPVIGNRWDNYTELGVDAADADDDGFGDIPYSFVGNQDPKPRFNDGIEGQIIFINGTWNSPYNWTGASKKFWVTSGDGTPLNPYVISPNDDWDGVIDAWGNESGISIVDSDSVYFRIEGITITDSSFAGIKLDTVGMSAIWASIENNNVSSNDGHGIYLDASDKVNITDNIITYNKGTGIYLYNDSGGLASFENKIFDNNVSYNDVDGIYIGKNSDGNYIQDNLITYNGRYGININETTGEGCNDTIVYYNTFKWNAVNANDNGTKTDWEYDNMGVTRGNFWADYGDRGGFDGDDDGIGDIGTSPFSIFPYNIDGSSGSKDNYPIWEDELEETALYIDALATGVNAHNWTWASKRLFISGSGSQSDPYVIQNVRFNGSNQYSAITILNSRAPPPFFFDIYFRIENVTLYNIGGPDSGKAGIYLYDTDHGDLINNTFSTNYDGNYGIHLDGGLGGCKDINITDNVIENEGYISNKFEYGLYLDNSGSVIPNTIFIDGNIIRNNDVGIYLNNWSSSNNITNNEITNNTIYGILIRGGSAGNKIYYNNISRNGNGTKIEPGCLTNKLISNDIKNNTDFGVYINSTTNSIYYNNFTGNGINAQDDTPFIAGINYWYYDAPGPPIRGNFWKDYVVVMGVDAKDADDDGIGDIEYNITGVAKASDEKPIWEDGHNGTAIEIAGNIPSGYKSWQWAASRTWCTGSGIVNDPYIISGLDINAQLNGSGIYIHHSSAAFRIEGAELYNSSATSSPKPAGGIRLVNVRNGTIINNILSDNDGHGIIIISNNILPPYESSNIIIQNNIIENNNGSGIYINGSNTHDNLIDNNTISLNQENGISVVDNAYENTIIDNIFYNNTEVGIYIEDFQPMLPTGHWEWPPPLYYMVWVIDPWDRNYIYNNTITLGETGIGIESSYEIIISGNTITQTESNGIAIGDFNSKNITIQSNTIHDNDQYGINFGWDNPSHTQDNYILGNNISNNGDAGIYLQQCFGSTFTENTLDGNIIGISLAYLNSFNTFTDNNITDNTVHGVGIYDLSCESNKIYRNNFTGNGLNGFDFGLSNEWYFINEGNYWDDYTGNDTNDNGIGDTPYDNIGGELQDKKDYFPIWWDAPNILNTDPIIDGGQFPFGNARNFEIRLSDGTGDYFWYEFRDGPTVLDTSNLKKLQGNPGEIVGGKIDGIMWGNLDNGTYTIRFYVNDSQGMVSYTDVSVEKLRAGPPGAAPAATSSSSSSSDSGDDEEELMPWYIQAALTGAVSASVGLVIKQTYSSAKKRKVILEKIHENFSKVENLENFLKDKLAFEEWEKIQGSWKQYQNDEITERQLIKKSKKT